MYDTKTIKEFYKEKFGEDIKDQKIFSYQMDRDFTLEILCKEVADLKEQLKSRGII